MGHYSFNVPTGSTYTIQVASGGYYGHYTPTCPASGTLTVSAVPSTGNDFGVECPPGFDLEGNITGWRFRPGTTTSVCVYVYNQRCNTPSGQIELTFDPGLTPLPDSTGTGYTVSGNTVTLPINSPDLYWSFCIPVAVDSFAVIGDSLCITMNITPVTGDSVPSNNSGTFCFPVSNSFDPNDKYAVPAGDGSQGFIRPNTPLTYTIRFQNTGNDVAYNVYVLDTLDADLDPASVEVIGNSHDMTFALLSGNILRFNFNNINLADSTTNEAASHGYITYRVNQIAGVAQMATIENSAAIYFDFNQPVLTNRTLHTIDMFLGVPSNRTVNADINIYPNPSSEKCILIFNDNEKRTITLTDAVGRKIFSTVINSTTLTLNTSSYADGAYMITVTNGNHTDSQKLIIHHR
jgi:uncharacterized repeat protein (TIGR01451 family)